MLITIPGELCDLNTYVNAQRTNYRVGNRLKQQHTKKCEAAFWEHSLAIRKLPLPLSMKITWFCANKRKDKDNVAFAIKFILDGMIQAGAIKNDGWKEIAGFSHQFKIDKENPRVEIEVISNDN